MPEKKPGKPELPPDPLDDLLQTLEPTCNTIPWVDPVVPGYTAYFMFANADVPALDSVPEKRSFPAPPDSPSNNPDSLLADEPPPLGLSRSEVDARMISQ